MSEQHSAKETLVIDGSLGEGGGQILRTALSLAMCRQQPVQIQNIRAGRAKPGLMRAHLAAVRAAAQVSSAKVAGAQLGSTKLRFEPGAITPGSYRFAIGSAGSTTLLLQTLLPALLQAKAPSQVTLVGGTHNPWAPSVDFIQQAFLRLLEVMNAKVSLQLNRHGFYPQGGGVWQVQIQPWANAEPLALLERGDLLARTAIAKVASVPGSVARRELGRVRQELGWSKQELQSKSVDSLGPGNILSLSLEYAQVTEVFEALGEVGLPAERVAKKAVRQVHEYLAADHPVGAYLADQLVLPMALGAGGVFRTGALSEHTRTNIQVIKQFLGKRSVRIEKLGASHLIQVSGLRNTN